MLNVPIASRLCYYSFENPQHHKNYNFYTDINACT